jgi:hypothetical protein
MARRRLDEIGEIVGFDVEGAGVVKDARQLRRGAGNLSNT